MAYSISLNKLKNIIAGVTVLTTISCLVPESAQAIKLGFSGSPNASETEVDFILDTSVNRNDVGRFEGAVQEVRFTCNEPIFGCEKVKGKEASTSFPFKLDFGSGDLTAYRISDDTVRYEAILSDANSNNLWLNIRVFSRDSELLTSLSTLSQLLETKNYKVAARLYSPPSEGDFVQLPIREVPEPDATGSSLVGALGAVSLLKGVKRSRKLQISQNSAVETQQLV